MTIIYLRYRILDLKVAAMSYHMPSYRSQQQHNKKYIIEWFGRSARHVCRSVVRCFDIGRNMPCWPLSKVYHNIQTFCVYWRKCFAMRQHSDRKSWFFFFIAPCLVRWLQQHCDFWSEICGRRLAEITSIYTPRGHPATARQLTNTTVYSLETNRVIFCWS
jgi:hypothetical protein